MKLDQFEMFDGRTITDAHLLSSFIIARLKISKPHSTIRQVFNIQRLIFLQCVIKILISYTSINPSHPQSRYTSDNVPGLYIAFQKYLLLFLSNDSRCILSLIHFDFLMILTTNNIIIVNINVKVGIEYLLILRFCIAKFLLFIALISFGLIVNASSKH